MARYIYAALVAMMVFCSVSCDNNATEREDNQSLSVDTIFFTDNHKYAYVYADIKADTLLFNPEDTTKIKYNAMEVMEKVDTIMDKAQPKIVEVRNIGMQQMDSLGVQILVIVDQTMSQQLVNKAKNIVLGLRHFTKDENLYIALMRCKGEISKTGPFMTENMETDFVSCSMDGTDKYLYRNILEKLKEMNDGRSPMTGRKKMMVVISDGEVWGSNGPYDMGHFEINDALYDFCYNHGGYPIFFFPLAEDDMPANINKSLQKACETTGGTVLENSDVNGMHELLCKRYGIEHSDIMFKLEYPDKRRFFGTDTELNLSLMQADSSELKGSISYHEGMVYNPIVVNGVSTNLIITRSIILVLILIGLVYLTMQIIIPYVKYRLFRRKYVLTYTGPNMSAEGKQVADVCYFCKTPFAEGDEIVARCEHTMHSECWEENGQHCPEYGEHCDEGSHYYNQHNLFDHDNAPYYMRWIITCLITTLVFYTFYCIWGAENRAGMMVSLLTPFLGEEEAHDALRYCYLTPGYIMLMAMSVMLTVSLHTQRHIPIKVKVLNIVTRVLAAGIAGYMCICVETLLCKLFDNIAMTLVEMVIYVIFTMLMYFIAQFNSPIKISWRNKWISAGLIVAFELIWVLLFVESVLDNREAQILNALCCNLVMVVTMMFHIKRSERCFLNVTGALKPMDVAIFKWFKTNPHANITIGKSVDCYLQLTWDLQNDIAPINAEIRRHKGEICLFATEGGVFHDNKELPVGTPLILYHGTHFSIGSTVFTFVEKSE